SDLSGRSSSRSGGEELEEKRSWRRRDATWGERENGAIAIGNAEAGNSMRSQPTGSSHVTMFMEEHSLKLRPALPEVTPSIHAANFLQRHSSSCSWERQSGRLVSKLALMVNGAAASGQVSQPNKILIGKLLGNSLILPEGREIVFRLAVNTDGGDMIFSADTK
ncbi:unnamed protein product, partial [Pleuronectes platessa]